MGSFYSQVKEALDTGHRVVVATIIKQAGSAPRGLGSKCGIVDDHSLIETIGGGRLEAEVMQAAPQVFRSRVPLRLSFKLQGADVAGMDMLCGGNVEVFLEPIFPDSPGAVELVAEIARCAEQEGGGLLVTALDEAAWTGSRLPKLLLTRDGRAVGSLPGPEAARKDFTGRTLALLRRRCPELQAVTDSDGRRWTFFLAPLAVRPVLYIFGGGHVSREIVPMAHGVDFDVVVIDDRPEFARPELFPTAKEVRRLPFENVISELTVDASSYLVIVTRGHLHDKTVLTQALRTDARYIGMIGSRRKRDMIYRALKEEGFTEADLARVHAPVGLEIGAETPAEIAVSIVAELIMVRAGHAR